MNPTLFNLLSIFFLHTVTLVVLCPSRYSIKKTMVVWGLATFISTLSGLILLPAFHLRGAYVSLAITVVINVVTVLVVSIYEVPKTIFLFLIYAQAFMVLVFLLANLITHFLFGGSFFVMSAIRTILHIILIILCGVIFKNKFALAAQGIKKGWWPLNVMAFLLLTYLFILIVHSVNVGYGQLEIVMFFLLLAMTVAVYWVFFHTINYMHNATELERLELQSEFLMIQVTAMQDSMEAAKRTNHDARHHNLQIAEYVRNGELDELLSYLHQYEEESQGCIPTKFCENLAANNILNAYARKAEKNGISVGFDVKMEQDIGIKDTDIVAIFANIMENAILACIRSKHPNPFIELFVGKKAGKFVIQSRNTTDMNVKFENGLPRARSGIGIPSILHSASKYGGETDFKNEGGIFICRILLKISSENSGGNVGGVLYQM